MAYLEEIINVKDDILHKIIGSQKIVDEINNTNIESSDELLGTNIFKDLFIPDTQSEAKTYICVGAYVNKIQNQIVKYIDLYFWIFSHQAVMTDNDGFSRVDVIQSEIDKIVNGSYKFGIDYAQLKVNSQFKPTENHTGSLLIYTIPELNQDSRFGENKFER